VRKKIRIGIVTAIGLLLLASGLSRLQFSADIFGLLPNELPVINALSTYQKGFKREQELLISVQAPRARAAESAAEELAAFLETENLVSQVIWQNPAEQDTEVLAELLALQWLNVPPARMQQLADLFDAEATEELLAQAVADSYEAIDPFEAAIGLSDPFGLAKLSNEDSLESSENLLASDDGRFRVLYLAPSAEFVQLGDWVDAVKAALARWQLEQADITLGVAGTPAFNQELGQSLMSDMQKAVLGTLLLVGLLFAWAHRRLRPLVWLLTLLGLVLATTVAIGGQLLGPLNVISLGYAAVLMGLAADYGLLLYQAHRSRPQAAAKTVREVAPSILWAALTTSVAFLMVARGSLPGMAQLGLLVAIGIAVAAVFVLAFYLWPLSEANPAPQKAPRLLRQSRALAATGSLVLVAVVVLSWQLPSLNTDPKTLGPKQLDARALQDDIDAALGRDDESIFVLFSSDNLERGAAEVQAAMQAARPILEAAQEQAVLSGYALPKWWPNADNQMQNRVIMQKLSAAWPDVLALAEQLDYPVSSMAVSTEIMRQFGLVANNPNIGLPIQPGTAWLFGQTAAINFDKADGLPGFYAVGQVKLADGASEQQRDAVAAEINAIPHAQMAGWPFASAGLLEAMKGDFIAVAVPMLCLLLLVLFLAFRGLKEILFSLSAMLLTLLSLSAVMVVMGWQWNLMNMLALPLLVGVTVDYSIHTQLALQRFKGDLVQVYNHVGRAIALAGVTTAIGFGSLIFSNSEGLSGLGRVASVGVVLACLISVLLQPHWWRLLYRRKVSPN
jgi:predicted RND superfamily exporter protein